MYRTIKKGEKNNHEEISKDDGFIGYISRDCAWCYTDSECRRVQV